MNSKSFTTLKVLGFWAAAASTTLVAQPSSPGPDSTTNGGYSSGNNSDHNANATMGGTGNDSSTGMAAGEHVKRVDSNFIKKAAKGGLDEVEIGTVAQDRATNPQVKEFARMMVTDHTKANSELMSIAATKGVKTPMKDKATEHWSKLDAKDFDRDYVKKMVSDHEEDVELFQKEARDGKDPEVVAFAQKTLPTLQMHLQRAQDLKAMLK